MANQPRPSPVFDGYPHTHRKSFIPLESNPTVFTQLIHDLGISSDLQFEDVYSIDEPDLLAFIPRPVLALILVFPTSPTYERRKNVREDARAMYEGYGEGEDVVWYKQTIYNACGLYGILHAVSNGEARAFIKPNTVLSKLVTESIPLSPERRTLYLESSSDLETAHTRAARQGDSAVPANADDEVDYHYICLVKSAKNGHLYEMDGDCKGPVDRGMVLKEGEDLLSENALTVVREYIESGGEGGNIGFGLMALVKTPNDE
ncbi:hypothetical protein JAAARDRAFT_59590 [Jaapia argillacea MUCL 33604]|uniref:Ubiquitin carboxyl-terminal hydrolase n=1 Tax=Jaapia argillacea MUCL 33604 TaxID=933084 RepID=A0A067PWB4_9AGAM|nr:hypothetical protein JAAARDRAFT_59590 [Jaapia argillacea MUCL 33604]